MRCQGMQARRGAWAPALRRPALVRSAAAPVATSAAPASTASSAAPSRPALRLRFGTKNIPHPKKAHYGGEDAYFVSEAGAGVAGIADGVGGWQEAGINPADYSRSLMKVARQYLEECSTVAGGTLSSGEWLAGQRAGGQPGGDALAAELAQRAAAQAGSSGSGGASSSSSSVSSGDAFVAAASAARIDIPPPLTSGDADGPRTAQEALDVAHRATQFPGSSTACVLRLDAARGTLDAANLGDSGFLIVRNGQLHFQSPAMQHFFDCPLQFGMPPDTDWAQDAAVFCLEVQPGDAIVMATDGLLDNLPAEDIVRLAPPSAAEVEQAAAAMAELASQNAADPDFESPYSREALEEGYDLPWWEKLTTSKFKDGKFELGKLRGGKMDDITVVCAYVVQQ
ncbi:serine threonine phosphatase [Micractinium conductrix]|uniref:Protein phosphatase n=1 Tax=Micractinium conductrix TaxID=554055 RepID=A0A2P6VAB3_9CHLO|nr:serine threonine phosphatase [Micractinium conductrix]|eukprot:PSC71030.1 serine threonine phosphatase [Micractinium conductrix]